MHTSVPSINHVWTKYGEPRLCSNIIYGVTDQIMKTSHKFNSQYTMKMRSRSGWYVPSITDVWIKYGESRLYGNKETDQIMKT